MKAQHLEFSEALTKAKSLRPVIDPQSGLDELLQKLESAYKRYGFENQEYGLYTRGHTIGFAIDMDH